jgi:hypothetical protein
MAAMPLTHADRRIADALFLLTAAVYAFFFAGGGWNQNSQFDLTRAIVERHTFAIDAYAGNTGDVATHGGRIYSNKSPGLSWLAAVPYYAVYAMEKANGISLDAPHVPTVNAWVCTVACVALPGAAIPALLYGYARRRRFGAVWSATVALTVALATQLFPYATLLMLHVTSGLLLLVALDAATRRRSFASGLASSAAAVMNYLCAPAVLLFGALTVFRNERRGRACLRYLAGAAPPLLLLALYQKICFGSFLTNSIAKEDARFLSRHALFGIIELPSLDAAVGITVSPYRGLFYFAPVLVMALAGFVLWWRSGRERPELLAVLALSAVFFGFNLTFNGWDGGFGIGARYLVPLIPLWGVAMLDCRGWLRPLFVGLAAVSLVFNFAAAAVDPQPSGTIPRPMTQYLLPLLVTGHFSTKVPITPPWSAATFTGHTSVNRVSMREPIPFLLAPPFSTESEWASFNLGEIPFGAGAAASLLPIVALMLAGAAGILWRARTIDTSHRD